MKKTALELEAFFALGIITMIVALVFGVAWVFGADRAGIAAVVASFVGLVIIIASALISFSDRP